MTLTTTERLTPLEAAMRMTAGWTDAQKAALALHLLPDLTDPHCAQQMGRLAAIAAEKATELRRAALTGRAAGGSCPGR